MKWIWVGFVVIISLTVNAQNKEALILIDIQDFYFEEGAVALVNPDKAAENAREVLLAFRKDGKLVVHVRHNFEPGGEINKLVQPEKGEKVISKNEVNAFRDTDLHNYLKVNEISNLVLCGMQTHMCLEAATRAAADLGYKCVVIGDACATKDLEIMGKVVKANDVHLSTLATLKSYAKITSTFDYLGH